jgi:hypothetical protein
LLGQRILRRRPFDEKDEKKDNIPHIHAKQSPLTVTTVLIIFHRKMQVSKRYSNEEKGKMCKKRINFYRGIVLANRMPIQFTLDDGNVMNKSTTTFQALLCCQ